MGVEGYGDPTENRWARWFWDYEVMGPNGKPLGTVAMRFWDLSTLLTLACLLTLTCLLTLACLLSLATLLSLASLLTLTALSLATLLRSLEHLSVEPLEEVGMTLRSNGTTTLIGRLHVGCGLLLRTGHLIVEDIHP